MTAPVDEVVELVSTLIRFDTTNTGDPATTKGEAECARWVAERLREVGYEPEYLESGAPGRGNVFVRLPGRAPGHGESGRGALLIHGHLDVVPAEAADWSVHPFSGAVSDGYVWGRGAVDMKDMCGMMLAVARHFKRAGIVPPRDVVFAFVADEEHGGDYGAHWLVEHRPDLFDGVTEAMNEDMDEFGLTRLEQAVNLLPHGDASRIAHCITSAIQDHAGDTAQFDDITLVVVKRDEWGASKK